MNKIFKHRAVLLLTVFVAISLLVTGCSQGVDLNSDLQNTLSADANSYENLVTSEISGSKADGANADEKETNSSDKAPLSSFNARDEVINPQSLPFYNGRPYAVVNNNVPVFSKAEKEKTDTFENYGKLDLQGRCTVAFAMLGFETMPTEERGAIGSIKPTGWHTVKYDCVDGKYLYNRCHLIGYQLSAENANERNLITGTRYLNVEGMLPFENMVADYIKETRNHVLYRVTPIFRNHELLARGVQIEAWSVEDKGEGICFNVYCFNVQPQITIDYASGYSSGPSVSKNQASSKPASDKVSSAVSSRPVSSAHTTDSSVDSKPQQSVKYVLNTNTKKFHYPHCYSAKKIKEENYEEFSGTKEKLFALGYSACGNCKP